MLSFTGIQTLCQDLTQDTTAPALTFFKSSANIGQHILETELGSFYTEESVPINTALATSSYKTPANFVRLKKAYITVGTNRYLMDEVRDEDEWQSYQQGTTTSNTLQKIFVRRDNFEVWPTPATANLVMTLIYEPAGKDLIADDYVTGTITTLTNGAKAVTASGSTFTSAMAGRYLKITNDGNWYKIASFGTTTTLTLDKNYEGISVAAGTEAYIIGQMPRTPEETHHIPAYFAVWQYYAGFKQNKEQGDYYRALYEGDLARAKKTYSRRYTSKYIPGNKRRFSVINPNDYPHNLG